MAAALTTERQAPPRSSGATARYEVIARTGIEGHFPNWTQTAALQSALCSCSENRHSGWVWYCALHQGVP